MGGSLKSAGLGDGYGYDATIPTLRVRLPPTALARSQYYKDFVFFGEKTGTVSYYGREKWVTVPSSPIAHLPEGARFF